MTRPRHSPISALSAGLIGAEASVQAQAVSITKTLRLGRDSEEAGRMSATLID
jgi:hypothetical protein